MKLILSRKGVDSSCGGIPSPIMPDGTLVSIPIPSCYPPITYGSVCINGYALRPLVEELTKGRLTGEAFVHLDPDLDRSTYPRQPDWRPLFGHVGAAQSHLAQHGFAAGDLFLFFGWFRQTELVTGRYRFVRNAPSLHLIYGWLQVDEMLHIGRSIPEQPAWATYHAHFQGTNGDNNTVYVARQQLDLPGLGRPLAGGGLFRCYQDALRLSAPGERRSLWQLPRWFYPRDGIPPLSYHRQSSRWTSAQEHTLLRSAPRGQEFVLDVDHYPEALAWVCHLLAAAVESRDHQIYEPLM